MTPLPSVEETRQKIQSLRHGLERVDGTPKRRARHLVDGDIHATVMDHFMARGEFFRAPGSYYLDKVAHKLTKMNSHSDELSSTLTDLGLLPGNPLTMMATRSLVTTANLSPARPVHRFSTMTADAVYVRASATRMFKVTANAVDKVFIGTDGVVLIADDLADWPSLADILPRMERIAPALGRACTQVVAGLAMSDTLTSRWSHDSIITAKQAHQMFVARVIFMVAAQRCSLWPITLITGDQESGKSTGPELLIVILKDDVDAVVKAFPGKESDLTTSLVNNSLVAYDNVDGCNFDHPDKRAWADILCGVSTGAEIDVRKLYKDSELLSYRIRNHALITARTNPFTRPDLLRRTLQLETAPPDNVKIPKDELKAQALFRRDDFLAEWLLRSQNIVRAYSEFGDKTYSPYQSTMVEYEAFTLRCAEYEGTLPETQEIWAAYATRYRESITEDNPLAFAARLWLGSGKNAEREVSPTTFFTELQTVFLAAQQHFTYRSATAIGKNIAKNLPALRALGFGYAQTRSGNNYIFRPSAIEQTRSKSLYTDIMAAVAKRPVLGFHKKPVPDPDSPWGDDFDDDPVGKKGSVQ